MSSSHKPDVGDESQKEEFDEESLAEFNRLNQELTDKINLWKEKLETNSNIILEYRYDHVLSEYSSVFLWINCVPFFVILLGWWLVELTSSQMYLDRLLPTFGPINTQLVLFSRWSNTVTVFFSLLNGGVWAVLYVIAFRQSKLPFVFRPKIKKAFWSSCFILPMFYFVYFVGLNSEKPAVTDGTFIEINVIWVLIGKSLVNSCIVLCGAVLHFMVLLGMGSYVISFIRFFKRKLIGN